MLLDGGSITMNEGSFRENIYGDCAYKKREEKTRQKNVSKH